MNSAWSNFLRGILKMPGAKINREEFLRKTFSKLPQHKVDEIVRTSPVSVLPFDDIDAKAKAVINKHSRLATAISTLAGIPGGIGMVASIPADLANYYYHIVSVGQKLSYLYGFPDMLDDKEELTDDGRIMLTAFIGIMNKVAAAQELVKTIAGEAARRISQETATRVARKLLDKQLVSQLVEIVAKKLGTHITAKTGGRVITKAIPLVSGAICGAITYRTFRPSAQRLRATLKVLAQHRE